ncbi:MAG: NUMOD4 motif-containing HNH endonuclease [Clostridiales bacterium]|nr:NUMOD4 motif-containing HNH endonuclease [Clostridiales bacterium]
MKDRCVECRSCNVQEIDIWKDIEGYEERYRISNKGEVQYRENNDKEWKTKAQKLIKNIKKSGQGYYYVRLAKSGKKELKSVHRLVAKTFIDNPENKETVNHKNGDTACNCVDNLEWMTQKENNQAYENQKRNK